MIFSIALSVMMLTFAGSEVAVQPNFHVRVLLAELPIDRVGEDMPLWDLAAKDGFVMEIDGAPMRRIGKKNGTVHVELRGGKLSLNGLWLSDSVVRLAPFGGGRTTFDEGVYEGTFTIVRTDTSVLLINVVELEEYVHSVARWESWPGWPIEVNKAQAIACRTYVVKKVLEVRAKQSRSQKPSYYDIGCTNAHQTYKGAHEFDELRQAIDETAHVILSHKKKPIIAMYDSCCGSAVPAHMEGVNFASSPYLARKQSCTHCTECKLYNWTKSYTLAESSDFLSAYFGEPVTVRDMRVSRKDKAGIVREVVVVTKNGERKITGKILYKLFKDLNSLSLDIRKKGKKLMFVGTGYGHQIGLCQWGAREMVRQGKTYKDILAFYYPGAQFMKVHVI